MTASYEFTIYLEKQCNLKHIREIRPAVFAGIMDLMFTAAIVTCDLGNYSDFSDRWCYTDAAKAKKHLDAWNGNGEPDGWHRHPATGRRVNLETGEEYVNP